MWFLLLHRNFLAFEHGGMAGFDSAASALAERIHVVWFGSQMYAFIVC
jgi:hypothetical protein